MVSGQVKVWQSGGILHIETGYNDDPHFTLEQERAFCEIADSFLMVNRMRERRKRYAENKKRRKEERA